LQQSNKNSIATSSKKQKMLVIQRTYHESTDYAVSLFFVYYALAGPYEIGYIPTVFQRLLMTILSTTNLSRRFGKRWAYARIDIQLQAGEKLLLIGANGSGKTTLLRTCATLLPPTLGDMQLFGKKPWENLDYTRRKIGFLSHKTGLYEDLSALENLLVFSRLMGKTITRHDACELLEMVGLEIRPEAIKTYSAGMRKRASIALLQLKKPELVLLDEPFSALDPSGIDEISSLLVSSDAAMIIVSHQVERASALCDRCVLLENGLIRWQGDASKAWDAWRASQRADS
jgi:heme exporter protein A